MQLLQTNQTYILLALLVVVVLQFGMILSLRGRVVYVRKMIRSLLTGPNGEDLEAMLRRCLDQSSQSLARSDELEAQLGTLAETLRGCVQHVGLVRFDAYGDVTGKQSFSLALLDSYRDGAIITGLFGRHDGRCYGKAVQNGAVEQALSEEESAALEMALTGGLRANAENLNGAGSSTSGKRRGK